MGIFGWFILGLLIGWVIELLIDWWFWRRTYKKLNEDLAQAEAETSRLRAQLTEAEAKAARLTQLEQDSKLCQTKLADAEETVDRLRSEFNALALETPPDEDCLERIEGVGADYARRFNGANIVTFAQLAQASPEKVRQAIQPEAWQTIDPPAWIARAKEFARYKADASQRIRTQFEENEQIQEKLTQAEAENSRLQALLTECEEKSQSLAAVAAAPTRFAGDAASLSQLAAAPTRQIPPRRDNLEVIDGIGPTYAKRLNEAGIVSFAQLAELTPAQIRDIIKPASWQKIDGESWIKQAERLSRPDELEKIVGIGEVYANRLIGAGVHSFGQLAQLTPEHVREIINPEDWHNIDPESWITQAGYLTDPDQLEDIDGIGEVYAQRLNEVGIFAFEQLAQLSVDRIQEIISAEEWQKIDAESWIAQAKAFVAKKAAKP
ncbi:MAG: DUF4332 domain-containing protein [Anaerolineae bacterium]